MRGDGGVLRNSEGKRFMFDYIPAMFAAETADTEEEGDRWYDDHIGSRRPPELLPRDEVARSINTEVKAGRGSPHGGVFLDIATRRSAEDIRRRLPSMYHQFKELAGVDITAEPMEVGPTCHYIMGGVRVDADTEATTVPGLFAAGEVAGGMHGANRLGGNSLSDLLVFGRRAGHGRRRVRPRAAPARSPSTRARWTRWWPPPSPPSSARTGENPYDLQPRPPGDHAEPGGHHPHRVRARRGPRQARASSSERATKVSVSGGQAYNPGWNLATDLPSMLTVSRCRGPGGGQPQGEPGRPHPRRLPEARPRARQGELGAAHPGGHRGRRRCRGHPSVTTITITPEPIPPMPAELKALMELEEAH